jgi:hypothetical protein
MLRIKFRYKDCYTKGETWSEQECVMSSVHECIKFYGLDQPDVEYQIVSVEEVA